MKAVSEIVDGVSTNLLFFDNRRSLEDFVESEKRKGGLNKNLFKKYGEDYPKEHYAADFYGTPRAKSFQEITNHTQFLGLELYQNQKNKINSLLRKSQNLGQIQEVPNKRLRFNDLGLGVFCFPRAAVALRKHRRPNDTIKIVSDVRDVYAYFPSVDDGVKTIALYQNIGANADISSNQMQYIGIALMSISEYLVENGYDIEIHLIDVTKSNGLDCGFVTKVKSTTDELNVNDLMLMTSDARWYRYKGFMASIAMFNNFNKVLAIGMGAVSVDSAIKLIEKHRKTDALPIILRQTYSEQAVLLEVNRVLGIVKNS